MPEVRDVSRDCDEVGTVVGVTSPVELTIACERAPPPMWEYVIFKSREEVGWDGGTEEVPVLAQVSLPMMESLVLKETTDPEAIRKIREMKADNPISYAHLRVLGYVDPVLRIVRSPRNAPPPGIPVYKAPENILREFYEMPEEERIRIGNLVTRRDVHVDLSVNGFRRHLAVLAATGAGKSYVTGIILEQLLEKGANIVVIDPHADYVYLGVEKSENGYRELPIADDVRILRNPGSMGDYLRVIRKERVKDFTVAFSSLDIETMFELAGIQPGWTKIREVIGKALEKVASEQGGTYALEDLLRKLEELKKSDSSTKGSVESAMQRLKRLSYLRIFGHTTTEVASLLKEPGKAVVVDLSGATDFEMDVATHLVVDEVFKAKINGDLRYPVFLFVEEAHRVIPAKRSTLSSDSIIRVAREGRKFGVFLTIVSQRPSSVDPDVLSMCQGMIVLKTVNPSDQEAIRKAAEKISEDLLNDLPGLNVGEAVVAGEIVKAPALVRISGRRSAEGGSDLDVVEELRRARRDKTARASTGSLPSGGEEEWEP